MQNLDPKEQFFGELGLVWFGLVWYRVWGFGSNQVSLLFGNNSHQALFVVVCVLWVVGCGLELRGWFCFLFCFVLFVCFFIWLPTREK